MMGIEVKFSYPISDEKWQGIVETRKERTENLKARAGFEKWPEGVKEHVLSGKAWEMQLMTLNHMAQQYKLHPVDRLVDVLKYWIDCEQRDAAMTDEEWGWEPESHGQRSDYSMLAWLESALEMVLNGNTEEAVEKLIDMNTNHPTAPPLDVFDFDSDDWIDMEVKDAG